MKKITITLCWLTAIISPCMNVHAGDDNAEAPKKMSSAERKALLKSFVETKENGDVIIKRNPAIDDSLKSKLPKVPDAVLELVLHIDPSVNEQKFTKMVARNAAASGDVRIKETMKGCSDYLSGACGISIKRISFNPAAIRARLNAGVPFFIAIYNKHPEWYDKIAERSQRRPSNGDWKEWQDTLRKERIKSRDSVIGPLVWCLIWGYNKESGEFLVKMEGREIWIAEPEIKLLQHSFYEAR